MAYRPTHETECCSGNVNRLLPNFVGQMWMTDADGGAVAAVYGPSQASFPTDKGDVTIKCETVYPFTETLTFNVSGAEGASIPLTLRIPTWCMGASIAVNGTPVDLSLHAGTFVKLPDAVKSGDVVTLNLPMTTEKKTLQGQGVYFQRGPLLYAYAIPQMKIEDMEEYENMHGKKPENPDFKCWNITPTGIFNYAYADDGQGVNVIYPTVEEIGGTIPFDRGYTFVNLRIPVKQIEWNLEDDRYTPALPEQGHLTLKSNETEYINLVPYGCTELRLTVFPDANAKPMPTPEIPDYGQPADAPDCVEVVYDCYYAYFEEPRFCWDEPIYCKVRMKDGTTDMHSSKDGNLCELVGNTGNGRKIWRWIGSESTTPPPMEIIFTNHDLLTHVMPFVNGGYYNYDRLLYITGQETGITTVNATAYTDSAWYDLSGRKFFGRPSEKGIYIHNGKKQVNE